jgi:hypothetical protein
MVSKTRIALVGGQGKLGRAIQEVVRTEILDRVEIAVVIGRDANPSLPNIFEGNRCRVRRVATNGNNKMARRINAKSEEHSLRDRMHRMDAGTA